MSRISINALSLPPPSFFSFPSPLSVFCQFPYFRAVLLLYRCSLLVPWLPIESGSRVCVSTYSPRNCRCPTSLPFFFASSSSSYFPPSPLSFYLFPFFASLFFPSCVPPPHFCYLHFLLVFRLLHPTPR